MTYPRLSLRVEHALTALMLLSVLLLSKLSSTLCSLSLKTPSFPSPRHTLALFLSSFRTISILLRPFFRLSPSTSLFFHPLLLLCFLFSYFFLSYFPCSTSCTLSHFLSSLYLPLSSFSSPPLCRPHQRSRSLVSLSLGWHREQADTWEGCFVIQQVIPP